MSSETHANEPKVIEYSYGPIARIRAVFRITLAMLLIGSFFTIRLLVRPLRRLVPRFEWAMRNFLLSTCTRWVLWIVGVRVQVNGKPPESPCFLVSNHLSYLDTFVFSRETAAVFVPMMEIRSWPVFGFLSAMLDCVFIDRAKLRDTHRVNEQLHEVWDQGRTTILIFPESTTSVGQSVLPFKPALLQPAVSLGMPVYHATLRYETVGDWPPASYSVCWVDDTPMPVHVMRLLAVPRTICTVTFAKEGIASDDRKDLAAKLEAAVLSNLDPMD
jgi:1-acyl-sn-glycerol-3-phosphate acyltransferase